MKRQKFRLGAVLKHYELQKHRAEQELTQASAALQRIDEEIVELQAQVAALAGSLGSASLSAAGWMAFWRKSEHLGRRLADARGRHNAQAKIVARCEEKRKRWAIAEESLLTLRRAVEAANQSEEAKAEQLQLQEAMLRGWMLEE